MPGSVAKGNPGKLSGTGPDSAAISGSGSGSGLRLIIGNKNYSSWSLRPWVLMQHAGIDFDEVNIPLSTVAGEKMLDELCPAKKVPVLYDGPLVLWDSFAICEYIADREPAAKLWPAAAADRARARAMCAEMHSGFTALRAAMPMNCRRVVDGFTADLETRIDINRIVQLMEQALQDSGGPWLFADYTVADAMFAPVASRFRTYRIATPHDTQTYFDHVLDDAAMRRWYAAAESESAVITDSEINP